MEELVQIRKNQVVCTSLQIANSFHKSHSHVLRDIEKLDCSEKFRESNFGLSSYTSAQNKDLPMYYITKDGFMFLVMGYNGKKAAKFKEDFIDAFNKAIEMLEQLQSQEQDRLEARQQGKRTRLAETDAIKRFVASAKQQGSKHANWYYANFSKLANKACGITDRDTATTEQLVNLAAIENIISHSVDNGISEEKFYKDIYKEADLRVEAYKEIAYIGTCLTDTERKERSKNL